MKQYTKVQSFMTHDEKEHLQFTIGKSDAGERLDIYLSQNANSFSRSQIKRVITEGNVRVNNRKVKSGYRLKDGDVIFFTKDEPKSYDVTPENIPLTIIYEDASIIVLDKPSGMVVHPAAGNYRGTIVNALLFHCKDLSGVGGVLRPGIVHRLDKQTSGLLIVAKSDSAHRGLSKQFKKHMVKKVYKALVHGNVTDESGLIELPVGRHPTDRKKMSTKSKRGKMAITRWKVIERYDVATLLDVEIETGRTHQIRVHLNTLGFPVIGDAVYGNSKKRTSEIKSDVLRSIVKRIKRQALHASRLGFNHPFDDRYLEFSSPLPDDMAYACEALRQSSSVQRET
jgi:23S rRNA pseudouridine1911/1915/1917 synthase